MACCNSCGSTVPERSRSNCIKEVWGGGERGEGGGEREGGEEKKPWGYETGVWEAVWLVWCLAKLEYWACTSNEWAWF